MDQTSSLSDLLLKGTPALGGILSQMGGTSGNDSSQNSLFCDLVSGTDAAQNAACKPVTETTPVLPIAVPASSSLPVSSSDRALQSTADLSSVLHKILAFLRQNNGGAPASQDSAAVSAAADAQDENNSVSVDLSAICDMSQLMSVISTIVKHLTDASQNVENSISSDPSTQDLADAIMELLTLMQLVVHALPPPPATDGGTSAAQESLLAGIQASMDAMDDLMAGMQARFADVFGVPAALTTATGSSAATTPPLFALLDEAKTFAKEILDAVTQNSPSGDAAAPADVAGVSDLAAKLAQIGTDIRNAMAALKQQIKTDIETKIAAIQEQVSPALPDDVKTTTLETPPVLLDAAGMSQNVQNMAEDVSGADAAVETIAPQTIKRATLRATPTEISSAKAAKSENPSEAKETTPASPLSSAGAAIVNALASLQDDGDSSFDLNGLLGKEKFSYDENSNLVPTLTPDGTQATGTYTFASTLSAFRAANGGVRGLPSVVDQVLLQLNRNVKNGQSQMSLQLQPTDLGKISVKLDMAPDGKVQGTVVADNPKTLEMLQKDSRSLERALQDAGLRAEPGSLQFSLGGQKNPNAAGQTADGTGNDAGSGNALSAQDADAEIAELGAITEAYYITPTGVNIRV